MSYFDDDFNILDIKNIKNEDDDDVILLNEKENENYTNDIIIKKEENSKNMEKDLHIPFVKRDPTLYHKKMTLIFGGSKTGKTTIVKDILYLLKNLIPNVFIIAPTNVSNNSFTGIVPPILIKSTLEQKWLEDLWERQKEATEIYQFVNNLDNLKSIYDEISDENEKYIEMEMKKMTIKMIRKVEKSKLLNIMEKKNKKDKLLKLEKKSLIKFYKTIIHNNKTYLRRKKENKYKIILNYLNFDPNILLLLDDCASQFKSWYKKCNVIKKIFYEGRHKYLTTIITAQDDKEIDSELRKNAMITIFTSAQSALANFERASNNYSKDIKEKAKLCISEIFKNNNNDYKKMVFFRDSYNQFQYIRANLYDRFTMCSNIWWILSKKMKKKNQINKNNRFISKIIK